ncbi:hypothetical protein P7H16_00015 [Paenibacillus larvae]|nr:hypothetical protein [Paenibacillus larvae]MDT2245715.1 hypothetical protein [Paenibacillus larvae]MDT2257455.1 hypothetical protein [Paenibacillus larvae]MDT2263938.1 hypothetical protein [Paenibacillus larvae]
MDQKANPWVWTEKAESKIPDRKAGTPVPIGFLIEGNEEYFPARNGYKKAT